MEHIEKALAEASRTAKTLICVFDTDWNLLLKFQSFRFGQYYNQLLVLPIAHAVATSPEHSATASGMLAGKL